MLGSTSAVVTGAIPTVASVSNSGWQFQAQIICDTYSSSGKVEVQGMAAVGTNSGLQGQTANTGVAANTAQVTLNTTTTQAIAVAVQWGASTSGNTITMRQFIVQRLGP